MRRIRIDIIAVYSPTPGCDLWDAHKYRATVDVSGKEQEFILPGIENTKGAIQIKALLKTDGGKLIIITKEPDSETFRHMLKFEALPHTVACFEQCYSWPWTGKCGKRTTTNWHLMGFKTK